MLYNIKYFICEIGTQKAGKQLPPSLLWAGTLSAAYIVNTTRNRARPLIIWS